MTVLALERLRVRYDEGNRPALWLLLVLFVFVVAARHVAPLILVGRPDDVILTPFDVLAAVPVLLTAAVVLVAPGRRLLLTGAWLLTAVAVLWAMRHLGPLLPGDLGRAPGLLATALAVAGPLLFGHGLGGARSSSAVALVVAGLVVSVLAAAYAYAATLPLLEGAEGIDLVLFAGSILGQFTYLGWAYVLAAAVERRARLIAAGAGLLLLADMASVVVGEFARQQGPGFALPGAGIVFLLLNLLAWAALIIGVIREADHRATRFVAR